MQIRRPKRRRWHPLLAFLLLSAPVVLIFWISTSVSGRQHHEQGHTDTDIDTDMVNHHLLVPLVEKPRITYERVPQEDAKIKRYMALEERQEDGKMQPLTIQKWAQLMTHNDTTYAQHLALNLTHILQESPFDGFFFETKGCSAINANDKQFEFVLVHAEHVADFAKEADPEAFSEPFKDCDTTANGCVFPNLDKSAMLIAPQNILDADKGDAVYGHLANFLRGAPTAQITAMWRMTAWAFLKRLEEKSPKTVWFSTSGSGVAWLHFRLDSQPKYYQFKEFANET